MAGMEVVRTLNVDGEDFTVYGTYSETNEMYDFYDIYVLNPDGGVLELVDAREAWQREPLPIGPGKRVIGLE